MAIYHLSTKPIKRSDGRTSTASSAYRSGTEITDSRTGKTHDYTNRGGVVNYECFAMQKGEKLQLDRSELWNKAEGAEKRKDSRTAREIVVSLPHELPKEERQQLVNDFSEQLAERYQCAIDVAVHMPDKEGDNRNHHAHIMMTTRNVELDKDGQIQLTAKTSLELSNRKLKELELPKTQEQIKTLREDWANLTNERLKENGIDTSIDHRSHQDRGLDEQPTINLGWQATELERQGISTDKGDINREIQANNQKIAEVKAELGAFKMAKSEIARVKEQAHAIQDIKSEYEQYKLEMEQERQAEQAKEMEQPKHSNDKGYER